MKISIMRCRSIKRKKSKRIKIRMRIKRNLREKLCLNMICNTILKIMAVFQRKRMRNCILTLSKSMKMKKRKRRMMMKTQERCEQSLIASSITSQVANSSSLSLIHKALEDLLKP